MQKPSVWLSFQPCRDRPGNRKVGSCDAALRISGDDRASRVPPERDLGIERNLSEERNLQELRGLLSAAMLDDLLAMSTLRTDEVGQVLDNPEDRNVDLLKHREPLAGVDQR